MDRGRVIIEIHSHFRNVTISSSNNQDMVTSQLESNHGLIRHLQSCDLEKCEEWRLSEEGDIPCLTVKLKYWHVYCF